MISGLISSVAVQYIIALRAFAVVQVLDAQTIRACHVLCASARREWGVHKDGSFVLHNEVTLTEPYEACILVHFKELCCHRVHRGNISKHADGLRHCTCPQHTIMPVPTRPQKPPAGIQTYFQAKIEAAELLVNQKTQNLRRLEAQRNALNARGTCATLVWKRVTDDGMVVRLLREELQLLHEPASYVGEVVKVMGKKKVLVKVQPEGKYSTSDDGVTFCDMLSLCAVVDFDSEIEVASLTQSQRVALRSDTYTIHKILPNKVDPLVSLMMVEKVPDSTYEMVGGLDKQIKEIKEVIELPVKHPELFEALGIAQPKGVLLYGPPGTGKTLLARAVAHHTDCKFIRVSGSELVQKYIGEGSRMVRELFVMAREHAPSIIFMDEIDSIGSSRGESGTGGGDSEVQRTMLELLNQLDGFEATKNIKVIMATNRIGECACMRGWLG